MKSWKSLTMRSVIVLVSILIGISVADLIASILRPNEERNPVSRTVLLKEYGPNYFAELTPTDEYLRGSQNLSKKIYRLRTDSDGFIIGEHDPVRAEDVDIIFFGGSTTECLFVDEALRFPYLIGELLEDRSGNRIHTLNAGVSAAHSVHSFIQLISKGVKYRPRFVVLMNSGNDLSLLVHTKSYWDSPKSRSIVLNPEDKSGGYRVRIFDAMYSVKNFLIPNLWRLIKKAFPNATGSLAMPPDEWEGYRGKGVRFELDLPSIRRDFVSSLTAFVKTARAWGIEPILMTEASRIHADDEFVRRAYEKYQQPITFDEYVKGQALFNESVRDVAKEEKVLLVDLDSIIEPSAQYIYDAAHLNGDGSRLAAETISSALAGRFPTTFKKKAQFQHRSDGLI